MFAARTSAAGVVCVVALAGCAGHTSGTLGQPSLPTHDTLPAHVRPTCPNPHGGFCLGTLPAGAHVSRAFHLHLSYTVPRGWQSLEDLVANYELLPPHASLAGVDAGTADYIGVYRDVSLEDGCATGPVAGLRRTPTAMMRHLAPRVVLAVSGLRRVHLAGLDGMVADLRQRDTWRRTCPYSGGLPLSSVLVGIADPGLDHPIVPHQTMRLYLLQDGRVVIAAEVEDVHSSGHLAAYSRIVNSFRFANPRV